ncbi:MAG: AarF/UbiB family protein [Polyangiaceae bacterium]
MTSSRLGRFIGTTRAGASLARTVLSASRRAPDLERVARVVEQVGELKGVAMKAGQILGYMDPSLHGDLRAMLSVLQKSATASPWTHVEATVRSAFGPRADTLLAGLERTPIAVASVGQVHLATLADGRRVVVKVRHPNIEAAFKQDLAGAGVGSLLASTLVPGAGGRVREMVDEARTAFLEECDYGLEASRQQRFRELFGGHGARGLVVPTIVAEWCAPSVLTAEYVPGEGLESFAARASQADRDRAAAALFEFYVGTLYRHGVFHADPHPGNFAFLPDAGVVVYDYGCVRTFEERDVAAFAALSSAVARDDLAEMIAAFTALGGSVKRTSAATLRDLLRGFFAPMLQRGPHRIETRRALDAAELLEDKRALLGLGVPGRMLFLFRLRFGLYAVFERLGAELDWAALEARARARAQPQPPPGQASSSGYENRSTETSSVPVMT